MSTTSSSSARDREGQQRSSAEPEWQRRYDALWASVGNPPRPVVARTGSPADVAAREWTAYTLREWNRRQRF